MVNVELSEIRKIQLTQFEMLIEFDRICRLHNIKYQLFAGTLLGSIRHKGFIPWDDDIDICLIRSEYEKFVQVAPKELSNNYFLQTNQSDPLYYKQHARLRKNNTLMIQKQFMNLDIHQGIWISLFPLDNIKPGTLPGFVQRKVYQLLLITMARINDSRSMEACLQRKGLKRQLKLAIHHITKIVPKSMTDQLQYNVANMFNKKDSEFISHITNGVNKKRYYAYKMLRDDFYDVIEGEFEGHNFPIPRNFDKILKRLYGDYLTPPPKNQQKSHHNIIKIRFNEKRESE